MTALILGSIGAALLAAAVWACKVLIEKATREKIKREEAEKNTADLKAGIIGAYKANAENEEKLSEILSPDLTDERAGELLSEPIQTGRLSDPSAPKDGNRPSS